MSTKEIFLKSDIKDVQLVVVTILYYAILLDNNMLVPLWYLALVHIKSTPLTLEALTQLLNYATSHPNEQMQYYAIDMT